MNVDNPVIHRDAVSDVRARFVADPFMVNHDGGWYMFFEVMNQDNDRGEIGLSVSDDGICWRYSQIVLREPFHLSYPHIFRWDDDYYMTPETLQMNAVCLYRADPFPTHWTRVKTILPVRGADPSIFRADDTWWLFTGKPVARSDSLRLYYSHHLLGTWQEHPMSPVVEGNAHSARPGGRVTPWDGKLIRYAQDCHACYGQFVRAFSITELTVTSYAEREVEDSPVLFAVGEGWNGRRMHHVDPHLTANGAWIACVDGC